jgi:hypothetical protein
MQAGVITFAAIGRKMPGPAEEASNIKRVWRWCHNLLIDVSAIQHTLITMLAARAAFFVAGLGTVAVIAIDWHLYDNGDVSGLRVSLMTGSRALPLLWYEFTTADLKGRKREIEEQAIRDLIRYRPRGVTWLMLLDAGFKASKFLDLLGEAGYFVVRSGSKIVVHSGRSCWTNISKLPVTVGQVVEFGWLYWNRNDPRRVRLVAARLYDIRPSKPGRRTRQAGRYKSRYPGLCPVITNLPMEAISSTAVIRLYSRRFEIEHSFKDIKNATFGMDMEHVHLMEPSTYSRLMCVVAITEASLWLAGSEAEARGLHKRLTPSRPKDGHRVLSLRNVGFMSHQHIELTLDELLDLHLATATHKLLSVVGRTWKDVKQQLVLIGCDPRTQDEGGLPATGKRKKGVHHTCELTSDWVVVPELLPMAA